MLQLSRAKPGNPASYLIITKYGPARAAPRPVGRAGPARAEIQAYYAGRAGCGSESARYALMTRLVRAERWSISIPMGICVAITFY